MGEAWKARDTRLELESLDEEVLHHDAGVLCGGARRDSREDVVPDLVEIWRVLQLIADKAVRPRQLAASLLGDNSGR